MPPLSMQRARPRWLCADGGFRLDRHRAWVVVEPSCASQRIRQWLELNGHGQRLLQRMRLVHCCSKVAAELDLDDYVMKLRP
jgi:hypothetical protein